MTDKEQMIVDGVNVSGCKFFNDITESYYCFGIPCKDRPNCYYKQLARKTQECKELKEEISKLQLNEYHYKNELKKYKKGIHKYRNLLKYEINDLRLSRREFLKTVKRYPKFEKDNIKLALDTFNKKLELIDNPSRYRKALEEIEKVINNILNSCLGRNTVGCRPAHNVCGDLINILDIINNAKGEGNE